MNIYKICKIIFINILFFIFLIIVIELILGNKIYKKKLKCEYLLCSVNLTYKNDLYSGTKNINYIKDRYGFRGLRKNVNEIDILTVGGSTTDERYLQTEDTWSEKLEQKINNRDVNNIFFILYFLKLVTYTTTKLTKYFLITNKTLLSFN